MNVSNKFKNIFYMLSKDKDSINLLLNKIQLLYDNEIINIEILLNIIKAIIFLLSIDNKKLYNYIEIFDYFLSLDNKKILNDFNIIDFSKQFNVDELKINKIILNTDYILNNTEKSNYKYITNFIFNITKKLIRLKTSYLNKIIIYNIYTDTVIKKLNNKDLDYHNMKFNELINNITKFLN